MCGFTGYFDPNFEHNEKIIKDMSNQLKSRGPDSCGFYIDRNIAERFRVCADKDGRNYSKVVQNYISRYVESRT